MGKKTKKQKSERNTLLLEEVMAFFKQEPRALHNYKQVCAALGIENSVDRLQVLELLEALVHQGQLAEPETGRFRYVHVESSTVEGKIDMTSRGAAYLLSTELDEDVYIREHDMGNALHGDMVKVKLYARRRGRKLEGEVVEIVQRAKTEFVGIVELSQKFAFVLPDSSKMPVDIFVALSDIMGK